MQVQLCMRQLVLNFDPAKSKSKAVPEMGMCRSAGLVPIIADGHVTQHSSTSAALARKVLYLVLSQPCVAITARDWKNRSWT